MTAHQQEKAQPLADDILMTAFRLNEGVRLNRRYGVYSTACDFNQNAKFVTLSYSILKLSIRQSTKILL